MLHSFYGNVGENSNAGMAALNFEHVHDVLRGAVTEKLAQSFFVVGNAMLFHQHDEIRRGERGQGRFGEVRIGGNEVFRLAVQVGEVAASAAGNQDLLADALGALQHYHTSSALAGFDGAHEPRRSAAQDDDVKLLLHSFPASAGLEVMSTLPLIR